MAGGAISYQMGVDGIAAVVILTTALCRCIIASWSISAVCANMIVPGA